jgi:hypothetical protein
VCVEWFTFEGVDGVSMFRSRGCWTKLVVANVNPIGWEEREKNDDKMLLLDVSKETTALFQLPKNMNEVWVLFMFVLKVNENVPSTVKHGGLMNKLKCRKRGLFSKNVSFSTWEFNNEHQISIYVHDITFFHYRSWNHAKSMLIPKIEFLFLSRHTSKSSSSAHDELCKWFRLC